jgi:hypothetical protein
MLWQRNSVTSRTRGNWWAMPGPVRRVQVRADIRSAAALGDADYAWACTLTDLTDLCDQTSGSGTPEDWARAVFEGGSGPMRAFLRTGWRFGLGLRLGSVQAADHVLGWPIRYSGPDRIDLTADSRIVATENVVTCDEAGVTWVTFVRYRNPLGRLLWLLAAPLHQVLIPRSLIRAGRAKTRG